MVAFERIFGGRVKVLKVRITENRAWRVVDIVDIWEDFLIANVVRVHDWSIIANVIDEILLKFSSREVIHIGKGAYMRVYKAMNLLIRGDRIIRAQRRR